MFTCLVEPPHRYEGLFRVANSEPLSKLVELHARAAILGTDADAAPEAVDDLARELGWELLALLDDAYLQGGVGSVYALTELGLEDATSC